LRAHKKATRSWDYKWLTAYAKGDTVASPVSEELQKPIENKDLEAIVGGIEKTVESMELVSPHIMRFNEWVLLNQVTPNTPFHLLSLVELSTLLTWINYAP
jgi:hypothetical protein